MARIFTPPGQVVFVPGGQEALDDVVPCTWTAWVYRNTVTSLARVMAKHNSTNGLGKNLFVDNDVVSHALRWVVNRGTGTTNASATSSSNTVPLGVWRFVAATYDPIDGPRMYVGSSTSPVAEVSYSARNIGSGAEVIEENAEMCFGARNNSGASGLDGRICDARVYESVLTLAQLNAVKCGFIASTNSLRGWWPMWGVGSNEPDMSGFGNHATVIGASRVDHPAGFSMVWTTPPSNFQAKRTTTPPVTIDKEIHGTWKIFEPTTATRFYPTNTEPELGFANYTLMHGAWDNSGGDVPKKGLYRNPAGLPATRPQSVGSINADHDCLWARFISDPIKAYTFTANDTIEWVLGVHQDSGLNAVFHIHVWVYQGDTETERGTLLSDFIGTGLFNSVTQGRTEGKIPLSAGPVSAQNGDRIGIEIGFRANSSNIVRQGTLYFGGETTGTEFALVMGVPIPVGEVASSDLAAGQIDVTTRQGWVEFTTVDALFESQIQELDGVAHLVANGVDRFMSGFSRITAYGFQTNVGIASVLKQQPRTIDGTAYIQPIITTVSFDINGLASIKQTVVTDDNNRLDGVANIRTDTEVGTTISGVSSILKTTLQTSNGLSRMTARTTQGVPGLSRISGQTEQETDGVAYIAVTGTSIRSIQSVARIVKSADQTNHGRARVLAPIVSKRFRMGSKR